MPESQIAVVGDEDFILGFKSLGCVLYTVDEKADLPSLLAKLIADDFLCIFILETFLVKTSNLIEKYRNALRPLIIPLPDFRKDLHLPETLLSEFTIKAVGQDIVS